MKTGAGAAPAGDLSAAHSVPAAFASNAFVILGASLRDSRRQILQLAEDRALTEDSAKITQARTELSHPRARVAVEVRWLPGISPKRANECLALVASTPERVFALENFPPLALANLLAATFATLTPGATSRPWAQWLCQFANVVDRIDAAQVRRDLNEDRVAAGVTEISSIEWVETELAERRLFFKASVLTWLNRFGTEELLQILTQSVEAATAGVTQHAPRLIEDVVIDFELKAQPAFTKADGLIRELLEQAGTRAPGGEIALNPILEQLERVVREWAHIAKPAQLCAKSRGEEHAPSEQLFYRIRKFGINLANKHQLFAVSERLATLLRQALTDVRLTERAGEDADALKDLIEQHAQAKTAREEFEREITYAADIGWLLKKRLAISPQGLQWGSERFSLETITCVRWGGVRHSWNGIPTGSTYHLAFGSSSKIVAVELYKQSIFEKFTSKLFRAVGPRLITGYATALKEGNTLRFGDILVHDEWCEVPNHSLLRFERIKALWSDLHVWSANGFFVVGIKSNKKAYGTASYKDGDNAHLIEAMIRAFFKDPKNSRISETLT